MKKKVTAFLSLIIVVVAVILMLVFGVNKNKPSVDETSDKTKFSETEAVVQTKNDAENISSGNEDTTAESVSHIRSGDRLFIGDSRTVGLMEYSGLENTDFFCDVGMSVYNLNEKTLSVVNVGKVNLNELLNKKKYAVIHIMLGINELGYDMDKTVSKYGEIIDSIKKYQPDAVIFVEANLHISNSRSESDDIINNSSIDKLNLKLSNLADGKTVFYIDANPIFDGANGGLDEEKTSDGTHLYAKYYAQWGEWIGGEFDR